TARDVGDEMLDRDRYLPLHAGGGLALRHAGHVADTEHLRVAHVPKGSPGALEPALVDPRPAAPWQRTGAHDCRGAHRRHHVDEVVLLVLGPLGGAEGGEPPARVDLLEHTLVPDLDAALLEQHPDLLGDDGNAEQA